MITTKLRLAGAFLAAACGIATASWGQQPTQKPNLPELLESLHSTDESERVDAFEQLRSNPANLQNPTVRTALLDLLDRENHELYSQLLQAQIKGYPE